MNDNERIGALVVRRQANATRLAGLNGSIEEKAAALGRLALAVQRHYGPRVKIADDSIVYEKSKSDGGGDESIPLTLLADLQEDLLAWESANGECERIAECLRQAGIT